MLPAVAVALPAPPGPDMHASPRQPVAHPFAELLRQNQADAKEEGAAPSPACSAPPSTETARDDCRPSSEAENARPTDAQRERKVAQRAPATRRASIAGETAARPAAANKGERPTTTDERRDGVASDPAVPPWLADWHPMPPDAATGTEAAGLGEAVVDEDRGVTGAGHAKRAGILSNVRDDWRQAALDEHADTHAFALSAGTPSLVPQAASDPPAKAIEGPAAVETSGSSTASTPMLPSLPTLATAGTGTTASTVPVVAGVPTPFGSPDFAAAFGLQVSLLARDGHHKAKLHLNPAEMGPVSVQIVVDGTQARIDFGADVASTRQAIEAGLPELASALRDAGLTLHGGGVSSHAGSAGSERGERDGASGEQRARGTPTAPEARAQRLWPTSPGGVDLYA